MKNNIAHYRKLKGLTQTELSELTGISRTYISFFENGKTDPSDEELQRISKALEVDPDSLMANKDIILITNLIEKTLNDEIIWETLVGHKKLVENFDFYPTIDEHFFINLALSDLDKSFYTTIGKEEFKSGFVLLYYDKDVIDKKIKNKPSMNSRREQEFELILIGYSSLGAYYFATYLELAMALSSTEGLHPYPSGKLDEIRELLYKLNRAIKDEDDLNPDIVIDDLLIALDQFTGRVNRKKEE